MRKLFTLLAATLLFSAASLTSSLLAQGYDASNLFVDSIAGYYATVEEEGEDAILYIRYYDAKPTIRENVIYVLNYELSKWKRDISADTIYSKEDKYMYKGICEFNLMGEKPDGIIAGEAARIKKAVLDIDENFKPISTNNWFSGFSNLEQIEGLEKLNTELVTDMSYMFAYCKTLKSLNLSKFNTSSVIDMNNMFSDCKSLRSIDISNFNTKKVSNTSYMFYACSALEIVDLGSFSSENITNMEKMFANRGFEELSLKYIFCDKAANINTSKVENTEVCFGRAEGLCGIDNNGNKVKYDYNKTNVDGFALAENGGYLTKKINKVYAEVDASISEREMRCGETLYLSDIYITRTVEFGKSDSLRFNLCAMDALVGTLDFDNTKPGKQIASIVYGSDTLFFEVNLDDVVKNVYVTKEPSVREYRMPFSAEDLDLRGGTIRKDYFGDSSIVLAMVELDYTVNGLDTALLGEQTLILSFDFGDTTFDWEYKINVLEAEIEKPEEDDKDAVEDLIVAGLAFEAWASGGVLNVSAVRGGVLEVFSPRGVLVRRMAVAAGGSVNLPLEKGVYVLRMGGEVKKVVVE